MAMVFSEATENKEYGYGIYWPPSSHRWIESPQGHKIELFMSSSDLGWVKVRYITNASEVAQLLSEQAKTKIGSVAMMIEGQHHMGD